MSAVTPLKFQSAKHKASRKSDFRRRMFNPNRIEGLLSLILGLAIIIYPSQNSYQNAMVGLVAGFCILWTGLHLILEERVSHFAYGFAVTARAIHASAVLYDIFLSWDTARSVLVVLVFGSVFISIAWKLSQAKE